MNKPEHMTAIGYNRVTLLGAVSGGPWHNGAGEGKAESAAFGLAIPEAGRGGETYRTFVRCEVYGRMVAHALALHTGDTVLIEGKLSCQLSGEGKGEGRSIVRAWRIVRMGQGSEEEAGERIDRFDR